MVTIGEALLSDAGENATSIQPIVKALSELGFNEHEEAGGAFSLLDADQVPRLTVRQRLALKAVIQAVTAGRRLAGVGSATGAGEADVQATIKRRAPCSAKYVVHLTVPASPPYKEAATVVGPHHVATYAHEEHSSWQCGQTIPVAVHCPDDDRRTHVDATVMYHDKHKDVAILEVQRELAAPVLDMAISAGDMYYVHGQSTQAQADATSISHGMVAATELDALSHIRGDNISGKGDSGGGCFSVATGKLMALVVGGDPTTKKAILVPIAVISSILTDLAAQRRRREQPPGCAA